MAQATPFDMYAGVEGLSVEVEIICLDQDLNMRGEAASIDAMVCTYNHYDRCVWFPFIPTRPEVLTYMQVFIYWIATITCFRGSRG